MLTPDEAAALKDEIKAVIPYLIRFPKEGGTFVSFSDDAQSRTFNESYADVKEAIMAAVGKENVWRIDPPEPV
jgi:hypothetical protein